MLKLTLPRGALALWLIGLLLAGLTLAACGSAAEPAAEEAPAPAETEEAVGALVEADEAVEAEETAADEEAQPDQEAAEQVDQAEVQEETAGTGADENLLADTAAGPAECQTIDVPDNQLIAAVADGEWSKGPEAAPVTLIEYGDFQ